MTLRPLLAFPVRTLKPIVGAQEFPGSRKFDRFFRERGFLTGD
jgi:hypothetical protein